MRSTSQSHILRSMGSGANCGISAVRDLRKDSVVKSPPATPMMAKCWGKTFSCARLSRAGSSLRLVRSPVAPKMTMAQAAGALGDSAGLVFMEHHPILRWERDFRLRGLLPGFVFRVPAELEPHAGKNFFGQ